ncbi:MAG: FAD-binding oxidoreductase, partial [Oligoflexales bacterium]|nr:FAD-binding oxidoreductase [Oligoflexales bacterium]
GITEILGDEREIQRCLIDLKLTEKKVIGYGSGRSYGDSCLNSKGLLLSSKNLNHFLNFDSETGILECESGVQIAEIIKVFGPRGFFPMVTPGTKFVTIAGAIANDVHGKNHHRAGCFGNHVLSFKLLRSDGKIYNCSEKENNALFAATIGGMGLTGLIVSATMQLKKIPSLEIRQSTKIFNNLEQYFELSESIEQDFEYSVAWLDCLARGQSFGRGVLLCGEHSRQEESSIKRIINISPKFNMPFEAPKVVLNPLFMKLFNNIYFQLNANISAREKIVGYNTFFYPLDFLANWNRLYGKEGFFQLQFCVDKKHKSVFVEILKEISESGFGSFLAVLKTFGDRSSPGMLSFPRGGYTLALDFPSYSGRSAKFVRHLMKIISEVGGRIYPAKDALMDSETFHAGYPKWQEFKNHIDPLFDSDFRRRIDAAS